MGPDFVQAQEDGYKMIIKRADSNLFQLQYIIIAQNAPYCQDDTAYITIAAYPVKS